VTAFPAAAPRPSGDWRAFVVLLSSVLRAGRQAHQAPRAGGSGDALRRRDPDAWREVFEAEHSAIYRYAASRLGPGPEAEDVTSQVFAEAWANAARFGDQGLPVRAWLFGIARNTVNNHRRRLLKRPPVVAIDARDHAGSDPGLDVERLDLARALARLDAASAEVLMLRFVHGLSAQETAAVLGMTFAAVKGKQARALAQLREVLSADASLS